MLLGILAATALAPDWSFDYRSGSGLSVWVDGAPVIRGSMFQYYEPGWKKGHYSSGIQKQEVKRESDGSITMTFTGAQGLAAGTGTIRRKGNRLTVDYEFSWKGEKEVNVELMSGLLWAPAVEGAHIESSSGFQSTMKKKPYKSNSDIGERSFGPEADSYRITAPLADLSLASFGAKSLLFDARGFAQPFAQGSESHWWGFLRIPIPPGQTKRISLAIDVEPRAHEAAGQMVLPTLARTLKGAIASGGERLPLIPKPQVENLDYSKPVEFTDLTFAQDGELESVAKESIRHRIAWTPSPEKPLQVRFVPTSESVGPEAFELTITHSGVTVMSKGIAGSRHAVRTLAKLAEVHNLKLVFPTGTIKSSPATDWRGVHLFVGPTALEFHKRLWSRVLLPMGFNKVVLQCEQTEWESLPLLRGGIAMKRDDLAKLCDWYRSVGVEPIPLVQSFGHAEWLFRGGANLDVAFNRSQPYAVDPRKPGVKSLFEKLWAEVIQVTKPKTVHFGLDEVDMIGFPNDPKLTTELWEIQIPMLAGIARRHGVGFMLWGDKGLAPGDAVDAALGDDPENATRRRRAIPPGAYIGDWHYKAEPNPTQFSTSLNLWKTEGFKPIASMWFQPENIRGFTLAATATGAGTLQTTWAGYESSEANMLRHSEQFSAMVLAGDYSWSGRQDQFRELGYDPMQVLQRAMYGRPLSIRGEGGTSIQFGDALGLRQVGPYKFFICEPLALGSNLVAGSKVLSEALLPLNVLARELYLAVDTEVRCNLWDPVAKVEIETAGGMVVLDLIYGVDIKEATDPRGTARQESVDGISVVRIPLGSKDVRVNSIRVIPSSRFAGMRIHAITAL